MKTCPLHYARYLPVWNECPLWVQSEAKGHHQIQSGARQLLGGLSAAFHHHIYPARLDMEHFLGNIVPLLYR